MKAKYGTYYKCATGSITGSYYLVWRWDGACISHGRRRTLDIRPRYGETGDY